MQRSGILTFVSRPDGLQFVRGKMSQPKGQKWCKVFKCDGNTYERGTVYKPSAILSLSQKGVRIEIEPVQPRRVVTYEGQSTPAAMEAVTPVRSEGDAADGEKPRKRGRPAKNAE